MLPRHTFSKRSLCVLFPLLIGCASSPGGSPPNADTPVAVNAQDKAPPKKPSKVSIGRICSNPLTCADVTLDAPELEAECPRSDLAERFKTAFEGQKVAGCEDSIDPLPEVDALTFSFEVAADGHIEVNTAMLAGEGAGLARGEEGKLFGCVDDIGTQLKKLSLPPASAACTGKQRVTFERQ